MPELTHCQFTAPQQSFVRRESQGGGSGMQASSSEHWERIGKRMITQSKENHTCKFDLCVLLRTQHDL